MKAHFLKEAQEEMDQAAQFYESRRVGLGGEFYAAVERAINDIKEHPHRWPVRSGKVRRRLVGRFPYGVLYRIGDDEIVIMAVMHLHRHPHYWIGRLKDM